MSVFQNVYPAPQAGTEAQREKDGEQENVEAAPGPDVNKFPSGAVRDIPNAGHEQQPGDDAGPYRLENEVPKSTIDDRYAEMKAAISANRKKRLAGYIEKNTAGKRLTSAQEDLLRKAMTTD